MAREWLMARLIRITIHTSGQDTVGDRITITTAATTSAAKSRDEYKLNRSREPIRGSFIRPIARNQSCRRQ
jgi:hypothetical protein